MTNQPVKQSRRKKRVRSWRKLNGWLLTLALIALGIGLVLIGASRYTGIARVRVYGYIYILGACIVYAVRLTVLGLDRFRKRKYRKAE